MTTMSSSQAASPAFVSDSASAFTRHEVASSERASSAWAMLATREQPRRNVLVQSWLAPEFNTLSRIIDLEIVPQNWDGHGGQPATMAAINAAIQVLGLHGALLRTPDVGPRADGGIHLEWVTPHSIELDVEPDGRITVLVEQGDDWLDFEFDHPSDPDLHEKLQPVRR